MKENLVNIKNYAFGALDRSNGFRVDESKTVVINGFWRSGTTWLQEVIAGSLHAKRIFEPFQARAGYVQHTIKSIQLPRNDYAFWNGLMPYIEKTNESTKNLASVIDHAQRGVLINYHVLRDQKLFDLRRCFASRVVVKYVNGALCLRYIFDRYGCPILHMYRDPRAVVASIKGRSGWGEGAFDEFSLRCHLLDVDDGRFDFFSKWADEIHAIEETDDVKKLAAYYFLTEKFVEHGFGKKNKSCLFIRFEDMIADQESTYERILQFLNVQNVGNGIDFNKPSSTSYLRAGEKRKPKEQLNQSWKITLEKKHIKDIEDLAGLFDMEDRLVN